jgi:hypothetical protein
MNWIPDMSMDYLQMLETAPETMVHSIQAQMTYFPLCCSTGVLQGVQANPCLAASRYWDKPSPRNDTLIDTCNNTELSVSHIITQVGINQSYMFPISMARWHAMDLIRRKVLHGDDRHGPGAYSGFKASQITMFDRLLEDKDPEKGFKYTYNMTWSVGHLMDWLATQGDKFGEFYLSPPVPGAHGARVYGCIFTPDGQALQKYIGPDSWRTKYVREYVKAMHRGQKAKVQQQTSAQAATKEKLPTFVGY